mmetsp:Transcript_12033/g.18222  ORF Transcript_12033/g.18222 Transcript_12033/m.18222 type:complete len:89 (+) Transcript_12033:555-821(+)
MDTTPGFLVNSILTATRNQAGGKEETKGTDLSKQNSDTIEDIGNFLNVPTGKLSATSGEIKTSLKGDMNKITQQISFLIADLSSLIGK